MSFLWLMAEGTVLSEKPCLSAPRGQAPPPSLSQGVLCSVCSNPRPPTQLSPEPAQAAHLSLCSSATLAQPLWHWQHTLLEEGSSRLQVMQWSVHASWGHALASVSNCILMFARGCCQCRGTFLLHHIMAVWVLPDKAGRGLLFQACCRRDCAFTCPASQLQPAAHAGSPKAICKVGNRCLCLCLG